MSAADDNDKGLGGDDAIAAEYVLGVLDAVERQTAAQRIDSDANFARLVDQWDVTLAPLNLGYQPVEPPASVKQAIDRRLFASTAQTGPQRSSLWHNLAFWRGLTFAAIAASVIAVAVPLLTPPPAPVETIRYVASLAPQQSDVHYFAVYDASQGEIGLSHVTGALAPGRDFELWVIEGNQPPQSLGVIPGGQKVLIPVSEELRRKIAAGAVFAISLEPQGGSTTGAPTGPVVAAGDLRDI